MTVLMAVRSARLRGFPRWIRTPEMVRDRLAMSDPFMQQILDEGKVLYETDNSENHDQWLAFASQLATQAVELFIDIDLPIL